MWKWKAKLERGFSYLSFKRSNQARCHLCKPGVNLRVTRFDLVILSTRCQDDSIDMEDDPKMTVSIWKMTLSIWDIVSLCMHRLPCDDLEEVVRCRTVLEEAT